MQFRYFIYHVNLRVWRTPWNALFSTILRSSEQVLAFGKLWLADFRAPSGVSLSWILRGFLRSNPHQIHISLQFATAALHTARFRCLTLSANVHTGNTPWNALFSLIVFSIERVWAFGEAWFISSSFRFTFKWTEWTFRTLVLCTRTVETIIETANVVFVE